MLSTDELAGIDAADLATVLGGARDIPAFGRCGPADRWQWLGDVYTPECAAHDRVVRDALASGSSKLGAQVRGLPLLPAAIGSYVRSVMTGGTSSGSR